MNIRTLKQIYIHKIFYRQILNHNFLANQPFTRAHTQTYRRRCNSSRQFNDCEQQFGQRGFSTRLTSRKSDSRQRRPPSPPRAERGIIPRAYTTSNSPPVSIRRGRYASRTRLYQGSLFEFLRFNQLAILKRPPVEICYESFSFREYCAFEFFDIENSSIFRSN